MGYYVIATTGDNENDEILLFLEDAHTHGRAHGRYKGNVYPQLSSNPTESGNELLSLIEKDFPNKKITISEDGELMGLEHKISSQKLPRSIHLLSDIDGVAFDWFDGFAKYMVDQGEHYTGELPKRFDMTDVFPLNKAPHKSITAYQASQFYVNAPLYPEVKSALENIRNAGIPITFITSCGNHPEIRRDRGDYFAKHLPGIYDDIIFLPLGDNKNNILKTFNNPNVDYFMIDDQVSVCEVAVKHGINPILKDMDYNREDNRFIRADNYTQLANHLVNLKNGLDLNNMNITDAPPKFENHTPLSRRVS